MSEVPHDSDLTLKETADGSHSLFSKKFQDCYHSDFGAIQESQHIYIQAGLKYLLEKSTHINLLELGFGTGLNCLLTRQLAEYYPLATIHYDSYEPFPVPSPIIRALNYGKLTDQGWFDQIHRLAWDLAQAITTNFVLHKIHSDIEEIRKKNYYHLIYYDAFAPQKQPHLWELPLLKKIADSACQGAILVTYCCQGNFQRTLRSVGFTIEKLPGPTGKREILRATKI